VIILQERLENQMPIKYNDAEDNRVKWKRQGLDRPAPKSEKEVSISLKKLGKKPLGKDGQRHRIIFEK